MLTMASGFIVPILDKIQARIAVSEEARRTAVQHLGGDAWIIPNGVFVKDMQIETLDERFTGTHDAPTLAFLGRIDEPRKGLPVVAKAFPAIREAYPGVRLLVAGRGETEVARAMFGEHAEAVEFLGGVSDEDKALLLGSADIYLAPNTGGESFGIILVEAMSAGAFVVASDIPAFRAVLSNGEFGAHFRNEDSADLASVVNASLADPERREQIAQAGAEAAWRFDWGTVASHILSVYETAIRTAQIEVDDS